jgi:hypothetical protein
MEMRMPESRLGIFCDVCGNYGIRRTGLDRDIGFFGCEHCGRQFERRVLPLFIVTGASGSGKTAIIPHLQHLLPGYGVFDKDWMWATDADMVHNNFFRIASALAQGGSATVILGTLLPEFFDGLSDRDLVGQIRYANLHCAPDLRAWRLMTRRTWDLPDDAFIRKHQKFAEWLLDHADSDFGAPMPTFDTTFSVPEAVAFQIANWVTGQDGAAGTHPEVP